ncbi:DmsC/YnfH family molybdoenzyme membrane anchor subunit [Haloferula chungangensis]|uniref:DmsC/YnfH family molybdoenzyme membrane anchor subunit n=1 Tax=Haloferula chungangensis TaxID=1048331 RepID=A0ABW2L5S6_9BACT
MVTNLHPSPEERVPPPTGELRTLIDDLIAEQSTLQTPVARFAEIHDRQPDLADHYRNLIPLTKPGEGEQYAFEVALDRCTGCKACVSACHSLNGLDDHEAWRDTGTLTGGEEAPGWQQTVTTACHHCESPECMNGCPVGAYEKEEDTGIVRHLDDQCIGCSYCILKCPFDVPKYSKKRGIVRKCDMCHQRLAEGEAPACVQACPTEAIRIVKVQTSRPDRPRAKDFSLFHSDFRSKESALPSSTITRPTTRYTGRKVPSTATAADRDQLTPQHAHWPLVFMLVLTQTGIGLLAAGSLTLVGVSSTPLTLSAVLSTSGLLIAILGAILFNVGMGAATLHLGQPLKAWRFFLGLKTSWLSREILAFSLFAPIPLILCALPFLPDFPFKDSIATLTHYSVLPVALAAIFTSVMIYVDTRRSLWRFPLTAVRFFGTTLSFLLLGLAIAHPDLRILAAFAIILKMIPEARLLKRPADPASDWRQIAKATPEIEPSPWSTDRHSARLQLGPLRKILNARIIFAFTAAFAVLANPLVALPILFISEILERQLYFQSVQAPKMPGNFGPAQSH